MTSYATLPTLTLSSVLSAADANKFKDNLDYLRNPRQVGDTNFKTDDVTVAHTVTSTTFAYLTSNLDLSFQSSGEPILYYGWLFGRVVTASRSLYLDLEVDGSRIGDTNVGLWEYETYTNAAGAIRRPMVLQRLLTLSAGAHTIKIMYKMSAAGSADFFFQRWNWARPL